MRFFLLKSEILKQNSVYGSAILPAVSKNACLGISEMCLALKLRSEVALKMGTLYVFSYRDVPGSPQTVAHSRN